MQLLVTGAGGFIGSHLTEALLEAGHSVRALVRYHSRGDWGHLAKIPSERQAHLEVRLGDVTDARCVEECLAGCDAVLHLAALIGIPYSYHAPESYVQTNVQGTLRVLEAARKLGTRRVVVTSTSEVYGTALFTPITESHPLQGQSPYAATKIGADMLAQSYFRSFDLPVVTLRPFNTYGPRQSARAFIPTVLSQALAGRAEIEVGSLEPRRDLTFVTDTARAFVLAAETPGLEGETIHFGQGEAPTMAEVARQCLEAVGSPARLVAALERRRPEKSELGLLLADPAKAHRLLGWSPRVPLADGLRRTAEYIRAHAADYRSGDYVR